MNDSTNSLEQVFKRDLLLKVSPSFAEQLLDIIECAGIDFSAITPDNLDAKFKEFAQHDFFDFGSGLPDSLTALGILKSFVKKQFEKNLPIEISGS